MRIRTVLFYRDYRGFAGGHLKVWDYYRHIESTPEFRARIFFSPETVWDESNPWLSERRAALTEWCPEEGDIWFMAGLDWRQFSAFQRDSPGRPIINLIQGLAHSEPAHELYSFLRHRAVRICVSPEVAEAINETGQVNGPTFVIPNGLNLINFPAHNKSWEEREVNLCIAGSKNPDLASEIAAWATASGWRVWLMDTMQSRNSFLASFGESKVTLFLPLEREGFYLPPLEGMAQGTLVVCPDCIGNRSFCLAGENCLRPAYQKEAVQDAIRTTFTLTPEERSSLFTEANDAVAKHDIQHEYSQFQLILSNLDQIW